MVDRESFDRLMLEHLSGTLRFAVRLLGDPHEAEDLVQESMLRASRNWKSFRGASSFRTWLFQIVVNAFRDRLRVRRVNSEAVGDALSDPRAIDPSLATQGAEFGEIVATLVSLLPPWQREVLVLIAYEQMSPTEVAKMLEMSEQNVRTNLHFARQRLKAQLQPYMTENSR